jgi:dUTP pyrophosphatase
VTSPPHLHVKLLREGAVPPSYQTDGAAGLDLVAAPLPDKPVIVIPPGQRALVPTGIAVAMPPGYEGQVRPRSGLAVKAGVTVLNAPGTIDWDYRGEVGVILQNHGDQPFTVRAGDRVAQLIVAPVARVAVEVVETLDETGRGAGGFGHTGMREGT